MPDVAECTKEFFVNLHAPYDLAFVKFNNLDYTFDKGGRLLWIFDGTRKIERSLNNQFIEKYDIGHDYIYKKNRILGSEESKSVYDTMVSHLSEILFELRSKHDRCTSCMMYQHIDSIIPFLEKIIERNYYDLSQEYSRFNAIYSPIEIFPSDIPLPLIIQITEGCAYNKCSFCHFYKDKPFRVKSIGEFKQHIHEIKLFLGESIHNKKAIFLGDANALMVEQATLREMLDIISEEFTMKDSFVSENQLALSKESDFSSNFYGIYSFIDAYFGRSKSVSDFKEMKRKKVKKIYLGLESGAEHVLSFIKKCNTSEQVVELTHKIKEAGIRVGIMLIAGLGGDKYYRDHVQETVRTINRLDLGGDDSINISHLVLSDSAPYKYECEREGIMALTYDEEEQQINEIVTGFRFRPNCFPNIRGYEIEHVRF